MPQKSVSTALGAYSVRSTQIGAYSAWPHVGPWKAGLQSEIASLHGGLAVVTNVSKIPLPQIHHSV
jgi:hypothetical protein